MGSTTSIAWTDSTWNPIRGCSRISPGCTRCYAERVAARFSGPGLPYEGVARRDDHGRAQWTGVVEAVHEHMHDPLRRTRPRRVFVNSMSDLFHEALPDHQRVGVFRTMALCAAMGQQHVFQVLTKRADVMQWWVSRSAAEVRDAFFEARDTDTTAVARARRASALKWPGWPLPNVWLLVSVEDQKRADERIPPLLKTPARLRGVSYEPALGPVDFRPYAGFPHGDSRFGVEGLDWVIVGGESGHDARPFDLEWARSVLSQCGAAGTKAFVKQLGARPFDSSMGVRVDAATMQARTGNTLILKDRKGGDSDEWPEDLRVREFPVPAEAHHA